jgi:hypothetical protein
MLLKWQESVTLAKHFYAGIIFEVPGVRENMRSEPKSLHHKGSE